MAGPVWDGDGEDPWLPSRLAARLDIARAERLVRDTWLGEFTSWITRTSRRVLRGTRPQPDEVFPEVPAWEQAVGRVLRDAVTPVMGWAYERMFGSGFDWENRPAVVSYLATVRNRMVRTPQEVYDLVAGQIAAGVIQGEGIPELADRVDEVLSVTRTERWTNRAVVVARTECLLGDAVVASDGVEAVYRRWYEGPIFRVHMASGEQFSGTPNHPILTTRGWMGFSSLLPGDELACNEVVQGLRTSTDENIGGMPARIGEVYDALAAVGVVVRSKTGKPDFHGDGSDGYVDVATTDRKLAHRLNALGSQHVGDLRLELSHANHIGLARSGDPFAIRCFAGPAHDSQRSKTPFDSVYADSEFLRKVRRARAFEVAGGQRVDVKIHPACAPIAPDVELGALGFLLVSQGNSRSGQNALDGLLVSSMLRSKRLKSVSALVGRDYRRLVDVVPSRGADDFAVRGKRYPGVGEYGANAASVDAERLLNGVDAVSRPVGVDYVVRVEVVPFAGHVYNLTTRRGWFNYGPLYSGNTLGALNGSRFDAFQAFDEETEEQLERLWLSTIDPRTRPSHVLADGQRQPMGLPFIVGGFPLMFPGDPSGPPQETIQCRCTTLLVRPGEVIDLSDRQMRP